MNQFLSLPQQLASEHGHRGGSVSNFIVLDLGHIDQHICRRVVDAYTLEDGGSIVCNLHVFPRRGHEDFVHTHRTQGRFHQVTNRNGTYKRLKAGCASFRIFGTVAKDVVRIRELVAKQTFLVFGSHG